MRCVQRHRLFQLAKRLGIPAALAQRLAKGKSCSGIVRAKFDAALKAGHRLGRLPPGQALLSLTELFVE